MCQSAYGCSAEYHSDECQSAYGCSAEYHSDECHSAECYSAECHSAQSLYELLFKKQHYEECLLLSDFQLIVIGPSDVRLNAAAPALHYNLYPQIYNIYKMLMGVSTHFGC